ncbi:MAG: aminopeptidase [Rhodospirillales bacterium]|nr:aminopeptidase [Rhodospirillales bacterium]MCB9973210.1 aminopeptidase [Rhodospirillales bacterium]MCB9979530.1 aminopeptidase [Rhodospirillales bacterium]
MTYRLMDISPAFQYRADHLRSFLQGDTLYRDLIERTLDVLRCEIEFLDDALNILLEAQRLQMIHDAGLQQNGGFFAYYTSQALGGWHQQKSPPVSQELVDSLAAKIYNMRSGEPDYGLLQIGENVRSVAESIVRRLIENGDRFDILFSEPVFQACLMNEADPEGIKTLAERYLQVWAPVTRRMLVVPGMPSIVPPDIDESKETLYKELTRSVRERVSSGEIHFTLTCIPTEADAHFDGIPYEAYLKLYFEMCDQPWDAIDKAHRQLIAKLDAGKQLRFTNADGTDLSMSIDGMTFANSLIARNVPGSEVFSAPVKNSVNGRIVAKGVFSPTKSEGKRIENIFFRFQDGKIIEYKADVGQDALRNMIETDEGSCYLGEIGIGTNPHLKRHVANGLLVEKIGGSFHVALGAAYTMTEYVGQKVRLDNGNRSLIHWDITTMLYGKQGCIYLDGEKIMEDGIFLDPALEVLNHGWAALPRESRPEYWQNYDFANRTY